MADLGLQWTISFQGFFFFSPEELNDIKSYLVCLRPVSVYLLLIYQGINFQINYIWGSEDCHLQTTPWRTQGVIIWVRKSHRESHRWQKREKNFFFPFLVPKLKMLVYDKMQICCCSFMCAKSLQSGSTVCNPVNCSPPGSSVLGILQVRIMEWVAMPSSRESSWLRDRTHPSMSPALAGIFFTTSVISYAGIPFSVNL